ncbi:MAG TPA: GNAT family N-acetyltransferase [Sphingorhabdus sp.]|jgi:aminoglycoside 6'-N-acetyltransferase I|nr:GNAT family N-acetyltransferase [Sphingorhabdus sp.]
MLSISELQSTDHHAFLELRRGLFPDDDNETEVQQICAGEWGPYHILVAALDGELVGFIEFGERSYAEGCTTSPVAYIEGWYVSAAFRRRGVGKALIAACRDTARQCGYSELGSDAELTNDKSIGAHRALGFQEVGRIACFIACLDG